MSLSTPILRAACLAMATLALSLATVAATPAVSSALPAQSGAGESAFCTSLLERLQRYHTIATNPAEPQSVREFYRNRASALLNRAKHAGCAWAASVSITGATTVADTGAVNRDVTVAGLSGPSGRSRHRAAFDRLGTARRGVARAAKRTTTGGASRVPVSRAPMAAIKATTTGNSQQDGYCAAVAQLINEAESQGDTAAGQGNDAEADAWWDLADYYIDRATQNGCRFSHALAAGAGARVPNAVATKG